MKKTLLLAAALIGCGLFAASARVDISGLSEKGNVVIKDMKGFAPTKANSPGWVKDPEKRKCSLFSAVPVTGEWSIMEFSFTTENDGNIRISLAGEFTTDKTKRAFVIFDDVEINGEPLKNGSFEEKNAKGGLKDWWKGKLAAIVGDAKTGNAAIKVNHDNRVSQSYKVEAGKTYTFKANVKAAPVADKK